MPREDVIQRLWRVPLKDRVPMLICSIIESNSKDAMAIVKTLNAVVTAIATLHQQEKRTTIANMLRDSADAIEHKQTIKLVT
jgi:hypothetical protein